MLTGYFDVAYNSFFTVTGKINVKIQEPGKALVHLQYTCPPFLLPPVLEFGITQRRLLVTDTLQLILDDYDYSTPLPVTGEIDIKGLGKGRFCIEKPKEVNNKTNCIIM